MQNKDYVFFYFSVSCISQVVNIVDVMRLSSAWRPALLRQKEKEVVALFPVRITIFGGSSSVITSMKGLLFLVIGIFSIDCKLFCTYTFAEIILFAANCN